MILEPTCSKRKCKHYLGIKSNGDDEMSHRPICSAFPDFIPSDIAYGDNLHSAPLAGQENDITFEK